MKRAVFSVIRRPALWLALPPATAILLLALAPLGIVAFWSFWAFDPETYWIKAELTTASYQLALSPDRLPVFARTLGLALFTAAVSAAAAVPIAYAIIHLSRPRLAWLLNILFVVPFFTSALIRAFAWRLVLGRNGVINDALIALGLIDEPLEWLLFSNFAVLAGMTAAYLPFAIVPTALALARIEPSVMKASRDLGAGFWRTLAAIVVPIAAPGIFAGFLFVFVVALGTSTEIQLLGGAGDSSVTIMIDDVMRVVNFPLAFAIATIVMIMLVVVLAIGNRLIGLARMFEDLVR